ncbi:MOSC domain-containing protein [Arthrobacter sulfonylureivorans]|uniref:MOSC domain-containing protein n=1 Tax=Arthrobacter sulfonylureivorans TaxID=2486855 RepID=A0ABY3WBF4_9MICC|nr:MOSC domain-containing protein [Arthrobacter sulfonylureivorans]UNK47710.1 MOSC domain-containing protein [Arthrobacter sulfonylureivorans]
MTYIYPIQILHLLVSPAHAYFGRAKDGAAEVPTADRDRVKVVAGKGIVGDRFFGKAAHMDAAMTFMAIESLESIAEELDVPPFDPLLARRNVVLRGAQLAPLIGEEFAVESGGEQVRFRGGRHAHPCVWMDRMLAPGAHAAMRGRGGLRCQPLSDGILHRGPALLLSSVPLQPEEAGAAVRPRPGRLP